ncbi:MAG: GGDEF domain-containing protein [Proteobacteria bacterium]|nr:GGDEF domain-containing protein [Pseudomonadota bacterium]
MAAAVLITLASQEVVELSDTGDTTIGGRDADVDLGEGVSRSAIASIGWRAGAWRLRSVGGCAIDGQPVRGEVVLRDGQVIELGVRSIQFVEGELPRVHDDQRHLRSVLDPLTSTFTRRFLRMHLPRVERPAGVLMIDLDRFKRVNDQFGMIRADGVLRGVADRLKTQTRWPEHVVRTGGEEFVVVLPATSLEQVRDRAEWIRIAIEEAPFVIGDDVIAQTVSIGVALLCDGPEAGIAALREADANLLVAKANGRNRVVG